jgi:hypothetical protein
VEDDDAFETTPVMQIHDCFAVNEKYVYLTNNRLPKAIWITHGQLYQARYNPRQKRGLLLMTLWGIRIDGINAN